MNDSLSKNCERELACGGRAGTCSGNVNSIFGGEGSSKPDGTLSTNVRRNHRTGKHLFGDCRNPWVAGTWQRLKRRTDYAGSVLEGCIAEKTADVFPARVQHFGVWRE